MPTLAHEGNPKQDSITITAGDVLSTATLELILQWPRAGAPGVVLTPERFTASASCPSVFTWPSDRDPIPFFKNESLSGGAITGFSDAQPDNAPFDDSNPKWLKLDVETKPNCCGCTYVPFHMIEIPTMSFTDDQVYPVHDLQNWTVTLGEVTDTPYAGICAWVEDGSTFDNFTGYVLAANFELGVTNFMKYVNQSLCNEGTILGTINTVPDTVGDVMTISVYTDPNAASVSDVLWQLVAEINDINGDPKGDSPIDLQIHDSLMDVQYTITGRGNVYEEERNIRPTYYARVAGRWVAVDIGGKAPRPEVPTLKPSSLTAGHRHNRANVGFVALGNHPVGQDTGTFVGGQNQVFLGGTMRFAASVLQFGHTLKADSYSFGTGQVS